MPATPATEEETTGYLDRCISEMFYLTEHPRDEITLAARPLPNVSDSSCCAHARSLPCPWRGLCHGRIQFS